MCSTCLELLACEHCLSLSVVKSQFITLLMHTWQPFIRTHGWRSDYAARWHKNILLICEVNIFLKSIYLPNNLTPAPFLHPLLHWVTSDLLHVAQSDCAAHSQEHCTMGNRFNDSSWQWPGWTSSLRTARYVTPITALKSHEIQLSQHIPHILLKAKGSTV